MRRDDFGDNFLWGVATSAHQIEGAYNSDGKSLNIWDTFSARRGKVKNRDDGKVACDFYHNYPEDLALVSDLGIPNFRFSTAWTRIIPEGVGVPNPKGLDFYKRIIDSCLEQGLTPWLTLYHWDLPQALQDRGGWSNRDIIGWFSDYTDVCTRAFGDRVKHWIVLNEPMAFIGLGYLAGIHAPGIRSLKKFLAATHYTTLAQAEGGRVIRANVPAADIGTTFSSSWVDPLTEEPRHLQAAEKADAFFNRLFIEPLLGLGYPIDRFPLIKKIERYIQPGDMKRAQFDFDFIGLQNYTREVVRHSLFPPAVWTRRVPPKRRSVAEDEVTDMGWEVHPEGIYHLLRQFAAYDGVKRLIVSENGAAFPDIVEAGRVHDGRRTSYIQRYLAQILRAKNEGVPVEGYFVWTLLDNFEWAEGYRPRFGIVYVDFKTQERIVKSSGRWYQQFLSGL